MRILLIRRVVGNSMAPKLHKGQLLLATGLFRHIHPGKVVVINHDGKEKVKRVERLQDQKVFVIGDNLEASTDSRHFGWLEADQVIGQVFWPLSLGK